MANSLGGIILLDSTRRKSISQREVLMHSKSNIAKYSLNVSDYVHMDGPTIKLSIESIRKDIARTENALKQQSKQINTLL